ncbi:SAM-dependent methyltransferase [Saccharothrix xinjiangensis]|uniref:S-adenosyl-L-methionine-dependent methyltransferase n=1 Tax=Saccharothrix xinjiangensis TaxID=204798 RepID=A0ABV9Y9K0_9PSEU
MFEARSDWTTSGVAGLSAVVNCAARAVESTRAEPLIDDPLAALFVERVRVPAVLPTSVREVERSGAAGAMVASRFGGVRARVVDDFLLAANADGISQVVVFSPGFCTRAYRLGWGAGVDLYEVEQPELLDVKEAVLRESGAVPRARRHGVRVDPRREEWGSALLGAGFDVSRPVAWVAEGILLYLSARGEEQLFTSIRELSAPGSRLVMQYMPAELIRWFAGNSALTDTSATLGEDIGSANWNTEPRLSAPDRLRREGWEVRIDSTVERALALGVPIHEEFSDTGNDAGIEFPEVDEPDGFLFGTSAG